MIYFAEAVGIGFVKIGYAKFNVANRIAQWSTGCPADVRIMTIGPGEVQDEVAIHRRFSRYMAHGEWFRLEGELADFILVLSIAPESDKATVIQKEVGRFVPKNKVLAGRRGRMSDTAVRIAARCFSLGMTQASVANIWGVSQPAIAHMKKYRVRRFD